MLFVVVTVAAVVCWASSFGWRWYCAQKHADTLYQNWQDETGLTWHDAMKKRCASPCVIAGRNWCLAACAVPFSDRAAICRRYVDEVMPQIDMGKSFTVGRDETNSDVQWNDLEVAMFDRYKREAEEWLAAGTATGEPEPPPSFD
jgi:hypothetical protein